MNRDKKGIKGFTLVELIVIMTIVGIFLGAGILMGVKYLDMVKNHMCQMNRLELEKHYEIYLMNKNKKHSEIVFIEFLGEKKGCPDKGIVNYEEGKVCCTIHKKEEVDENVPVL